MGVDFFGNARGKCTEKACACTDFVSKLECVLDCLHERRPSQGRG
jgi:hypothetical protein